MAETPVQLAKEYDGKHTTFPVAVEDKLDGIRVFFKDGIGYTRNGKSYETLKEIAEVIQATIGKKGICIDSEVMGRNWNETPHLIKRKKNIDLEEIKKHLTIYIFDIFGTEEIESLSYCKRQQKLQEFFKHLKLHNKDTKFKFKLVVPSIADHQKDIEKLLARAIAAGKEGIMIKDLDAPYVKKRSFGWQKLKPFKDITLTITGYEHSEGLCPTCSMKVSTGNKEGCITCNGTGKVEYLDSLGTLICEYEGEVVRVGSGFSDDLRMTLWATKESLIGRKIDVKVQDEKGNDILARFPVFMRFRDDI